jgi:allantoin racemase
MLWYTMKIKVIIPNASVEFRDSQIKERKKSASPGTEVEVVCLKHGPVSIESSYDEALAAPHIVEEVKQAESEGFDAVSIDCAMDTVVRASREAVGIPVTSAGEASYLLAMGLCAKFSVVTVLKSTAQTIGENISKYGFVSRVASVRHANIPVLDLKNERKAFAAILKEAKGAIEEDGAEAIVLGCTGMSSLAKKLQDRIKVPVVDPAAASLRLAELYVREGLIKSRIAYGEPSKKAIK